LVGSARGSGVEVVEYAFAPGQSEPEPFSVLDRNGVFIVPNPSDSSQPQSIEPLPVRLGFGSTVGGFLDETR
ncbi:MAG TPA: hypothetical protein VM533_10530, partial [Fimbriiglobus sp.]|nr:hypothetical protein [Fimbriiglobus sp.]